MDRVKLYAQERLDLDDARALQGLIYDYVQEAIGGLFGHVRGALSAPTITQSENSGAPYVSLSAFQFVTSTPISTTAQSVTTPSSGLAYPQMKTVVVTYDPTEEASNQISIDTARAYYQDYVDAYLWARPVQVDVSTASRVKWDVAQGDEVTFSDETRSAQRVEFAVQKTAPAYAATEAAWAPIARIAGWTDADNSGSLAQWQVQSAYEHDDARDWMGSAISGDAISRPDVTLDPLVTSLAAYPMSAGTSARVFGVADQLAILRYKVAQLQGLGLNDPAATQDRAWYTQPLSSLNGLDARLAPLETQRTSPIVCIAAGQVQVAVSSAAAISYNLLVSHGISATRTSPTRKNRMCVELDADLLAQDWKLTHVDITQIAAPNTTATGDLNRIHAQLGDVSTLWALLSSAGSCLLDDHGTTGGRGVNIELTALGLSDEEDYAADDEAVRLVKTVRGNDFIHLSIAIYAIHDDQD
jgi:hypothetical protein